jgi:hypothetical protein
MSVPKDQIKQLLDGIPKEMPVLIDEAYHHVVDSPDYQSSMKSTGEIVGRHLAPATLPSTRLAGGDRHGHRSRHPRKTRELVAVVHHRNSAGSGVHRSRRL